MQITAQQFVATSVLLQADLDTKEISLTVVSLLLSCAKYRYATFVPLCRVEPQRLKQSCSGIHSAWLKPCPFRAGCSIFPSQKPHPSAKSALGWGTLVV